MKRLLRLFGLLFGMGAFVILGLVAVVLLLEPEHYRDQLEWAASRAFGRTVSVEGGLSIKPSLRPRIVAEGVTIGNPDWATGPYLARVDRLRMHVELLPLLLRGDLYVDNSRFTGVDLHLEEGDGVDNFTFGDEDDPTAIPPIGDFELEDITVQYKPLDQDWRKAVIHKVRVENERDSPTRATWVEGSVQGRDVRLQTRVSSEPGPDYPGYPWSVAAELTIGDLVFVLKGGSQHPRTLHLGSYHYEVRGSDWLAVAEFLGVEPAASGPIEVTGELTSEVASVTGLWSVQAEVVSKLLRGRVDLEAPAPYQWDALSLDLDLEGDDVGILTRLLGRESDLEGGFTLKGSVAAGPRRDKASSWQVNLDGRGETVELKLEGDVSDPRQLRHADLKISAKGPEVERIQPLFPVLALGEGPFDVAGHLKTSTAADGRWSLSLSGSGGDNQLKLEGGAAAPMTVAGGDFAFEVNGQALETVLPLLNLATGLNGLYEIRGRFVEQQDRLVFNGLQARIGESRVGGELAILHRREPRPKWVGKLQSELLHLADVNIFPTDQPVDEAEHQQPDARVIPDHTLPLSLLSVVDVEISLNAEQVKTNIGDVGQLEVGINLENGRLDVNPLRLTGWEGGKVEGTLRIDSTLEPPSIASSWRFDNLDYGSLFAHMDWTEMMEGKLDGSLELAGRGNTRSEILGSATGSVNLVGDKGRFASRDLDLWGSDLVTVMLSRDWKHEDVTEVNCVVARISIEDGVMKTDDVLMDTQRMTLAVAGIVNLATEEVDLLLTPEPKQSSLVSLANPARVTGTLGDARFSKAALPRERLLVAGGGAVAGLVNPAFLVFTFSKLGSGDKNPCLEAVEQTDKVSEPINHEVSGQPRD